MIETNYENINLIKSSRSLEEAQLLHQSGWWEDKSGSMREQKASHDLSRLQDLREKFILPMKMIGYDTFFNPNNYNHN